MRPTVGFIRLGLGVVGLGLVFALSLPGVERARALDTIIQVQVCQEGTVPTLAITSPASDTVFSSRDVTLEGTTRYISQVEVYIDDTYVNTEAIPTGSTTFSVSISLRSGTNTVTLKGLSMCDQMTYDDTLVLTYTPSENSGTPPSPSEGGRVPTVSNPNMSQDSGGGVVVTNPNPNLDSKNPSNSTDGTSFWQRLWQQLGGAGIASWLIRVTDVDTTLRAGSSPMTGLMVMGVVVGTFLATVGRSVFRRIRHIPAPWRQPVRGVESRDMTVRIVGLLMVAVCIVLLF